MTFIKALINHTPSQQHPDLALGFDHVLSKVKFPPHPFFLLQELS